jgi:glycosyltransferase involved in cell wall biosynthesis
MRPLLSIVIPTKNRYDYLKFMLNSILSNKSLLFEVIVQDNSNDNSDFLSFLANNNDSRFIYSYEKEWLSVIENCDRGVSLANGLYVCMLGDDDGILIDNSLKLLEILKENSIDAAIVDPIIYTWPDVGHAVWKDAMTGKAFLSKYSSQFKKLNTKQELNTVLYKGASFGLMKLPKVYHGFVKKSKLDELWDKVNSYFPGPSPDMANAVGLTAVIDSHVHASFPTIISGFSKKSTAGQGGLKKHHGKIESQAHLPKDTASNWCEKIPFYWSGPTIYSESAVQALKATGRETEKINFAYLYACCLVYEPEWRKETINTMKIQEDLMVMYSKIIYYLAVIFVKRIIKFAKNYVNLNLKKSDSFDASNIVVATDFLNSYYLDSKQN